MQARGCILDTPPRPGGPPRLRGGGSTVREYHPLERRRDVLRTAKATRGDSDPEAFDLLTRRLEAVAKDAGAGLAWLKEEYYEVARPARPAAQTGGSQGPADHRPRVGGARSVSGTTE